MSRFFLLIFSFFLFGSDAFWSYTYTYTLKKDQIAKIEIKKDYLPTKKSDGKLKFRWTLFSGDRLVLLVDYEGFKNQYLLEKRYKRDSIKVNLIGDYDGIKNQIFALIRFKDFKNNKATFDVLIRDPKKRVEVRFK